MIPDSFKQDLLNRVDVVDVVQRYVQLRKAGANYVGLCPFHNEKTPSFSVSPTKQFYHCFGCGAHGNAVGFLMAYAAMGYVDAVKELAAQVGMQVPESRPRTPEEAARKEREPDLYAVMEKAMNFYRGELKNSPRAIEYLKARGLTGEILGRFERKGLKIIGMKFMKATEAVAKQHYVEHAAKPFFGSLVSFITSSPLVALVLEGDEAVTVARTLIGATDGRKAAPGTIRGDFGCSKSKKRTIWPFLPEPTSCSSAMP